MLRIIASVIYLLLNCELRFIIELKVLLKENLPGDLPDTKLPYLTLPYRLKRCISEKVLYVDAQNSVWRIWGATRIVYYLDRLDDELDELLDLLFPDFLLFLRDLDLDRDELELLEELKKSAR